MSTRWCVPLLFKRYKVVACPRCGQLQAVRATKIFRCKFCGFEDRMARLRIFYATDDGREVSEVVRRMREKHGGRVR